MRPEPDSSENPPRPPSGPSDPSRRRFLRRSALAATVGVVAASSAGLAWRSSAASRDRVEIPEWTVADIPSQQGRTALVTGGNGYPQDGRSGLGYHAALALAQAGADVTIASRDRARGEEAVRRIRAEAAGATIRFETLDLANLASVRAFAERMRAGGRGLDILVNNAGVMGRAGREVSVDGFERVFATNTLGHFVLTALLLPLLQQGRDPRIVWVASMRTAEALPLDNLQLRESYDYAAAYDNTKLANLLLAFECERRSRATGWGVSSYAAHPGVARTNLIPNGPGLDSAEGWRFRWLPFLFQPAAQGALPMLYAATSPQAVAGDYYGPTGLQGMRGPPGRAKVPAAAQDPRSAAALWAELQTMANVAFG